MDSERFERIVKGLGSGMTRRRLLVGLPAVPVARDEHPSLRQLREGAESSGEKR